ncbi:MAG: DUF397 domain-containing protein [Pseudonocardiaceae bacterium]
MTFSFAARDVPSPQEREYGLGEVQQPPATACWRKSSASGANYDCVQVTRTDEHIWVRDSKNPLGPFLGFTRDGWRAFLAGVQRDEFDRSKDEIDQMYESTAG